MPIEEKIEHADGHVPLTEEPKSPVDKTPSEEHKVPSEEHKTPIEEQHGTTEEQKTHAEELEALVKEQREEAEETREGGVVTVSVREQEMEQAIGEADKVDSGEPEAKQEVDNQEDIQGKQEVEVNDYHSHLDQRAAVCITVDPQQEQVGVQNGVNCFPSIFGQLHPRGGESKQTKPSES